MAHYICVSNKQKQTTMKRKTTFFAITASGEKIEFDTRNLIYPKRTKTWYRLNVALDSGQLQKIGYRQGYISVIKGKLV